MLLGPRRLKPCVGKLFPSSENWGKAYAGCSVARMHTPETWQPIIYEIKPTTPPGRPTSDISFSVAYHGVPLFHQQIMWSRAQSHFDPWVPKRNYELSTHTKSTKYVHYNGVGVAEYKAELRFQFEGRQGVHEIWCGSFIRTESSSFCYSHNFSLRTRKGCNNLFVETILRELHATKAQLYWLLEVAVFIR